MQEGDLLVAAVSEIDALCATELIRMKGFKVTLESTINGSILGGCGATSGRAVDVADFSIGAPVAVLRAAVGLVGPALHVLGKRGYVVFECVVDDTDTGQASKCLTNSPHLTFLQTGRVVGRLSQIISDPGIRIVELRADRDVGHLYRRVVGIVAADRCCGAWRQGKRR
jgi:hypothetical protein